MTWNESVYAAVRRIPRGRVATYGQIAMLLGRPRGGREVGWALHACADPRVPCQRVVDRTGRLAPRFAGVGPVAQRDLLESEGVRFRGDLVDLARWQWSPRTFAFIDHPRSAPTKVGHVIASPRERPRATSRPSARSRSRQDR